MTGDSNRTLSVVILGGGLSGVAAAYTLAKAGWTDVTLIERGDSLGGLAGSFEKEGNFYPLGYHHILHRDRSLLFFLDLIGALNSVRWHKIEILFRFGNEFFDLGSLAGFMKFPMSLADKARFVRLMLRSFARTDWQDFESWSAARLVDSWASPKVRQTIFERLTQLRFDTECAEISGAWLGARLSYREGSAPVGFIPHANWTKVLCDGVTNLLLEAGVRVMMGRSIQELEAHRGLVIGAKIEGGDRVKGDIFVSTVPTPTYLNLIRIDGTPHLASINYSALISAVCATKQPLGTSAYWMNLDPGRHTACGIFQLSALNNTIGRPGETCINFVTHLRSADQTLFHQTDEVLMKHYRKDFREVFGIDLESEWHQVSRVSMYAPILNVGFSNPPLRSSTWKNLYFAGNYRTFPSVLSTGTALGSGVETASTILAEYGGETDLGSEIDSFRLSAMPRA